MRLTILIGSPRLERSNTRFLLDPFLAGFAAAGGECGETVFLARPGGAERGVAAFRDAEAVLLGFPLYADAMPSGVKLFAEALAPLCGRPGNPALLGFVQSGFPEPCHSRPVERWIARLATILGSPYLGTLVKGGGEGVRDMPRSWIRKPVETLSALGHGPRRPAASTRPSSRASPDPSGWAPVGSSRTARCGPWDCSISGGTRS